MNKRFFLLIILTFIFLFLSIIVKINNSFLIDSVIYKSIIYFRTDNLTCFFKILTRLGTTRVCLIIGIIIMLIFRKRKYLLFPFTTIVIKIINLVAKYIIGRPRPNVLRLVNENETSFPSGHAMLSITLYGLIIYLIYSKISKNSVKWILIILFNLVIFFIGISRIYLGVHYFTDIIGGYILGVIYLIIITSYIKFEG